MHNLSEEEIPKLEVTAKRLRSASLCLVDKLSGEKCNQRI